MKTITPPKIQETHIAFAKAAANLAAAHGIDRFQMTFRPKFEDRLGYDNPMKIEDTIINPNAIPAIGAPGTPNHVPGYPTAGILWRVTAVSNEGFIAHPWGEPESSRAFTNSQAKWFNAWDEPNNEKEQAPT